MATPTFRRQSEKNAFERVLQAFAQSRVGGRLFVTVFPAIDRRLMPLTHGRVRLSFSVGSLVLHVRGAKSGIAREVPLVYTPTEDGLILVASKAGAVHHPAWYHNVVAHPDVEVDLGRQCLPMRARELHGDEREAAWRLANENYSGYETYQGRAGARRIPVILLESRDTAAASP